MDIRAPHTIIDKDGIKWFLTGFNKEQRRCPLFYSFKKDTHGFSMPQPNIELGFTREGRPEPKTYLVTQGKYDCAAASLAMLLGESLFNTKRAMGKVGWCNDDRGANDGIMIKACRLLGRDLIEVIGKEIGKDIGPCSLTLPSLNIKGMYHAITWNGTEMLDPNYGRKDRKFWGTEWGPETIGARRALVLLDKNLTNAERSEYDEAVRSRNKKQINEIKSNILTTNRRSL